MNTHPSNNLFHGLNSLALAAVEHEACRIYPRHAERNGLYVLARRNGSFSYEWGNASISRREAALRLAGRAA